MSELDQTIREERAILDRKRNQVKCGNYIVLVIVLIITPTFGVILGNNDSLYIYQAAIFQSIVVIIALVTFSFALYRIKNTVKEIPDAFPRRDMTYGHFVLVICVLFFNIVYLLETFVNYKEDAEASCNTSLEVLLFFF